MFTLDELQSLVAVVNTAGKFQAVVKAAGGRPTLDEEIEFLKIAKRVGEEYDKAAKEEEAKKAEKAK